MNKPEPYDLREVAEDIKQLILATHSVQQIKDSFDYKGLDLIHNSLLAHSYTLKEAMEPETVEFEKEDGYDLLDIILYKTLQLGYQNALLHRQKYE